MTDPYRTLGVSPSASDQEVRRAYRRLVQLHHPDHNNGSPESARRFEAVQEAYGQIVEMRKSKAAGSAPPPRAGSHTQPPPDPDIESRLAAMQRDLREAYAARKRAQEAAREAARGSDPRRPTDEELGYFKTDDSFSKIVSDARDGLSDLLDELAGKLRGDPRRRG